METDNSLVEIDLTEKIKEIIIEQEANKLFPAELLESLPYTGDVDKCVMSIAQAEAFAAILDGGIEKSREAGYNEEPFCNAALFDAGDGIPALFMVWGYDMGYGNIEGCMSNVSQVYCWDGKQALLSYESHPMEQYIFSEDIDNIIVTDNGLLVDGGLYEFTGGLVRKIPTHVYEEFVFHPSAIPSAETYKSYISEHGKFDGAYSYDTLTDDKWQYYPEYGDMEDIGRWDDENACMVSVSSSLRRRLM